jgi:hypothetical protein
MLGSTLLGIFIIPVNFYVIERMSHRSKKHPPASSSPETQHP